MRRWWLAPLVVLLCLPAARAVQDKDAQKGKAAEATGNPKEQVEKLQKEFESGRNSLLKDFRAAKTDEERTRIRKQFEEVQKIPGKIQEIVEKNVKEPFAFDALLWLLQNGGDPDKTVGILAKDFVANPRIGSACEVLADYPVDGVEKLLRGVMEKNPDRTAQGIATLSLAKFMSAKAENERGDQAKKLNDEAESLFKTAMDKYADVKTSTATVGEEAKTIASLGVGKPAPDIQGEDADGKKFKLSDYKGKVVLLDFWGNW